LELSELTAYAGEKYHMQEQHKWSDFTGFSVLVYEETGKWVALLMRQWDYETGTEIQRCDIKCGQEVLADLKAPFLSAPFRMKGAKWVGVSFDDRTQPEVVFRLFDRAVRLEKGEKADGFTIVLEETVPRRDAVQGQIYRDTPISFGKTASARPVRKPAPLSDRRMPAGPVRSSFAMEMDVPDRILEMMGLYEYGNGSFAWKYKNFYRQGKFMEDYEDDAPWNGEYRHYFPVYHDLNIRQLRGYFTWRTRARKGQFEPISTSLVYIYLYELLCGIGTASPSESLQKMKEFETGFLDAGLGDEGLRRNLRRWMLEYAVVNRIPAQEARQYADPELLQRDEALAVLKDAQGNTDEALFAALALFAGKRLEQSPVCRKDKAKGLHLFAGLWREASGKFDRHGKDLFTVCFGSRGRFSWYPLANAVYWNENMPVDLDYELNLCRSYHCRNGVWHEERYENLLFDRECLKELFHAGDRLFRRYLKTGSYLREKDTEAWAVPYVQAVIEADRLDQIEAARPKIEIDLAGLEKIREDSLVTRDSLLTQEELDEESVWPDGDVKQPDAALKEPEETAGRTDSEEDLHGEMTRQSAGKINVKEADPAAVEALADRVPEREGSAETDVLPEGLDALHGRILAALLRGEDTAQLIREAYLMPSLVADGINEALFDEIGDNVLTWDGNDLTVVEDYREDVAQLLGMKE